MSDTLHLNLKAKWFDMIASGEKKEEYREIKPYWINKFDFKPKHPTITFSNGYSKDRRQMVVQMIGFRTAFGIEKWGAPKDKRVYCLQLGRILTKNF